MWECNSPTQQKGSRVAALSSCSLTCLLVCRSHRSRDEPPCALRRCGAVRDASTLVHSHPTHAGRCRCGPCPAAPWRGASGPVLLQRASTGGWSFSGLPSSMAASFTSRIAASISSMARCSSASIRALESSSQGVRAHGAGRSVRADKRDAIPVCRLRQTWSSTEPRMSPSESALHTLHRCVSSTVDVDSSFSC